MAATRQFPVLFGAPLLFGSPMLCQRCVLAEIDTWLNFPLRLPIPACLLLPLLCAGFGGRGGGAAAGFRRLAVARAHLLLSARGSPARGGGR